MVIIKGICMKRYMFLVLMMLVPFSSNAFIEFGFGDAPDRVVAGCYVVAHEEDNAHHVTDLPPVSQKLFRTQFRDRANIFGWRDHCDKLNTLAFCMKLRPKTEDDTDAALQYEAVCRDIDLADYLNIVRRSMRDVLSNAGVRTRAKITIDVVKEFQELHNATSSDE